MLSKVKEPLTGVWIMPHVEGGLLMLLAAEDNGGVEGKL
jgi:hypothetical protein